MNVLFVTNGLGMGGVETNIVRLTRELTRRGHRVLAASDGGALVADFEAAGGEHVHCPLGRAAGGGWQSVRRVWRAGSVIRRLAREQAIDAVHVFSSPAGIATWLAFLGRRLAGRPRPLVVASRLGLSRFPEEPGWRPVLRVYLTSLGAQRVISFSPSMRAALRRLPIRERRIVDALAVGIDLPESVDTAAHRASVREELGLAPDALIVTTAGSLSPHKSHELFVRAAAHIAPEVDDAVFLLAGEGALRGRIEQAIRDAGVGGRLRMIGMRRDLDRVLAASDVYVRPGVVEGGVGTTVLHAQALGVPVISFESADVQDAIEDGVTGLLVPASDDAALGKAILQLLRDPEYAASLAAAARQAVARHGVGAVTDSLLEIYGSARSR